MRSLSVGPEVLDLDRVVVVGIVNVTPDSFSDGGAFLDHDAAVRHALQLVAEGADIVDVGGESTRPGAKPVSVAEEMARVTSVVRALAEEHVVVSIDTRHHEVAAAAIANGAVLINDVSGLRDAQMRSLVAEAGVPAVVMHSPVDDPATMQQHIGYTDVVSEVGAFLQRQVELAHAAGIDQLIVDPGIGFGKTTAHNLELIDRLDELAVDGCPIMIGASRKRFIGELSGTPDPGARLGGSIAAHLAAVSSGARLLRVHDVAQHRQALDVWLALHHRSADERRSTRAPVRGAGDGSPS